MQRFFCLILAVCLMICSLAACDFKFGGGEGQTSENSVETTNETATDESETTNTESETKNTESETEAIDYSDMPEGFARLYSYADTASPVWYKCSDDHTTTTLYVKKWDEYFSFQYIYDSILSASHCCADISTERGIYVMPSDSHTDELNIYTFEKGCQDITESILNLPETIWINRMFFNFTDENTGFLFVFEEGNLEKYQADASALVFLYKTQDGGKTWALVECDNTPYISRSELPIYAEFLDDNIGVFSGQFLHNSIARRSFITFDGGETWEQFSEIPCPEGKYITDIEDINCSNGIYTMYVKAYYTEKQNEHTEYIWEVYTYTSTDMINWELQQ